MKRTRRTNEAGYTLIELIISITLLTMVTGALVATFITTNNANANTSERIHESNDAQLTAGFWTADAQAAGGVDPGLGTTDTTLGVSKTDPAGCGSGTLVTRFKWREWTSRDSATAADTFVTRVANYFYDASTHELRRQTCANGASTGVVTLASRVASAPTVRCDGSLTCPTLPNTVTVTVTETNDPVATSPGPYTFTLSATVRSDAQSAPTSATAASSPLLVMGGSCTTGVGINTNNGNVTVRINGQAMINATDGAGCNAVTTHGSAYTWDSDGTSIAYGGTCGGNHCPNPPWPNAAPVGNPFSALQPPSTSGCGSGTNPLPDVFGVYPPGVYPQTLNLSGSQSLAPVTAAQPAFVLCNGISGSTSVRSNGVFLYVVNGGVTGQLSLAAPTSGAFQSIALWINSTTTWNIGNVNIDGAVYGPKTDISMGGNSSLTVSVLIAHSISLSGTPDLAVTGTGKPRSPILTAQTGSVLRTVNLQWTPQQFPGITIIGYELSADRGTGFGPWTTIAGGAATTTLVDVCGSAANVVTTCKYQVRALSAAGAGSPSNIATADSFADTTAPTVTVTPPGATVGTTTIFSGTASNGATDGVPVSVQLYAGSGCTPGTEIGGPLTTNRTGTSWSVASPTLTYGAKSVCASQSDTAGNTGTSAPANFTVQRVTGITMTNANGRVAANDTFTITFGQAMSPASICTGWNGTTTRTTLTVTVTNNDPTTGNNDSLSVNDSGCAFNFGKINLGSQGWVTATTSYGGGNASTAVMNATLTTLTIKVGTGNQGPNGNAATTMTYTPSTLMTDSIGNAMTGAFGFPNLRF